MNVFAQNIWMTIRGGTLIAADKVDQMYTRLAKLAFLLLFLVLFQWILNVYVWKELNYILFFIGGLTLFLMGLAPKGELVGAIIGIVRAKLTDNDLSQGAYKGILGWIKAVTAAVFGWWLVTGVLAVWPFASNPGAFWPIAAATCIITALYIVDVKVKWFREVVITCALLVIIYSFLSTLPRFMNWWDGLSTPQTQTSAGPQTPPTEVPFPKVQYVPGMKITNAGRWEVMNIPKGGEVIVHQTFGGMVLPTSKPVLMSYYSDAEGRRRIDMPGETILQPRQGTPASHRPPDIYLSTGYKATEDGASIKVHTYDHNGR